MEPFAGVSSEHGSGSFSSADPAGVTLLIADGYGRPIYGRMCAILHQPVKIVEHGLEAVNAYKQEPERLRYILLDIHMAVMSGLGAAREIRKFEEAHNIKPAVIIGLRMRWPQDAIPDCLEAGFDAITIGPLSTDFFREFLCGPPETNLFVQYGCLSQDEQRWHAQRYRRALASPGAYLQKKTDYTRRRRCIYRAAFLCTSDTCMHRPLPSATQ